MPNTVVYYDSQETGAPVMDNAAGSVIALLDACLITGFGNKAVTSISVAAGMATVVCAGHGFADGRMVDHAGATPSALNGRAKITVVDVNTYRFPTAAADGAASGTITAKRSPLGWTKAFSGTNKAIYARTDVEATGAMFRVEDTRASPASATSAYTTMVESATGVDALGPAASSSTIEKGADTTAAKRWVLVGDSRTFYLFTEHSSNTYSSTGVLCAVAAFGEVKSFRAGDAWRSFSMGFREALCPRYLTGNSFSSSNFRLARSAGGIQQNVSGVLIGYESNGGGLGSDLNPFGYNDPSAIPGNVKFIPRFPSPVDGGFAVQYPIPVLERNDGIGHAVRGVMPGLAAPLAAIGSSLIGEFFFGRRLPGVAGTDRDFLAVSYGTANVRYGCILIDITGPWQ